MIRVLRFNRHPFENGTHPEILFAEQGTLCRLGDAFTDKAKKKRGKKGTFRERKIVSVVLFLFFFSFFFLPPTANDEKFCEKDDREGFRRSIRPDDVTFLCPRPNGSLHSTLLVQRRNRRETERNIRFASPTEIAYFIRISLRSPVSGKSSDRRRTVGLRAIDTGAEHNPGTARITSVRNGSEFERRVCRVTKRPKWIYTPVGGIERTRFSLSLSLSLSLSRETAILSLKKMPTFSFCIIRK